MREGEGYSIYLVWEGTADKSYGPQYDYTRSDLSEGLAFHPVAIGDDWFTVCTWLDENNREIIRYCAYVYYEDEHDAVFGYPDEIRFEGLTGYPFKSVELNADMTVAVVTYYDGEEEKLMEYEIPDV